MKRKVTSIMALALSGTMLLTSCSLVGSKKDKKKTDLNEDIVEVVEGYFSNLAKMKFDKVADVAEDTMWTELNPTSDEEDVLEAFLKKVEIEVTEAEGDEDDEEGSATFTMTYVDLDEIVDDLDDDADADDLIDAISDKKAPTAEEEIEIDLVYDDDWMIKDDSDIFETLVKGFESQEIADVIGGGAEPTTTTTEEPTTTTTDEPTTTTTDTPTTTTSPVSGGYYTEPTRTLYDKHIISADEILKIVNDLGMEIDDYSDDYCTDFEASLFDDNGEYMIMVEYIGVKDKADFEDYLGGLNDDIFSYFGCLESELSGDYWYQNGHYAYFETVAEMTGSSAEFFTYMDEDTYYAVIIVYDGDPTFPSDLGKLIEDTNIFHF